LFHLTQSALPFELSQRGNFRFSHSHDWAGITTRKGLIRLLIEGCQVVSFFGYRSAQTKRMEKPKGFGRWLLEKRQAAGLSQQQVADRAKVSKQYVSNLERSAPHPVSKALPKPSLAKVDALAGAVGAPLAEARLVAGFAPPETGTAEISQARLLFYFNDLPEDARGDALAMLEAFWRNQQTRNKARAHPQKLSPRHKKPA
jgi:transcriptional regulator with XRE-family HTH domain